MSKWLEFWAFTAVARFQSLVGWGTEIPEAWQKKKVLPISEKRKQLELRKLSMGVRS